MDAKNNKWISILIIASIIIAIVCIAKILDYVIKKRKNKTNEEEQEEQKHTKYVKKKSLLTDCEKKVYHKIQRAIQDFNLIVTPQVNLATIVDKVSNERYRNELFRNIDFGVFEADTLKPVVMIELNDSTHRNANRYARDMKVKAILQDAGIPLITLHADMPNDVAYIRKRVRNVLLARPAQW